MKPVLFVGLDGPVLVPSTGPSDRDEYLGASVASYAKPFLHWATQHFDVRWLSDRGAPPAAYVTGLLSLPSDKIHIAGYTDSKVDALAPHQNFYWVDSELIPHEVAWLTQNGHMERLVPVDPQIGVSPDTKKVLEARAFGRR